MENKVTADYVDEEGCLHCGICGKRKQMKVSLMGFEHVVSCLCECEVKARQELDEKMQREEAQRLLYQRKSVGLRERRFWEWKFENDNGSNQKILIARQYVENWTDMKRKNVGLLLMGPVGTGHSASAPQNRPHHPAFFQSSRYILVCKVPDTPHFPDWKRRCLVCSPARCNAKRYRQDKTSPAFSESPFRADRIENSDEGDMLSPAFPDSCTPFHCR